MGSLINGGIQVSQSVCGSCHADHSAQSTTWFSFGLDLLTCLNGDHTTLLSITSGKDLKTTFHHLHQKSQKRNQRKRRNHLHLHLNQPSQIQMLVTQREQPMKVESQNEILLLKCLKLKNKGR